MKVSCELNPAILLVRPDGVPLHRQWLHSPFKYIIWPWGVCWYGYLSIGTRTGLDFLNVPVMRKIVDTTGSGSCSRRELAKYPGICRRAFLICKVDLRGWPLNSENPPAIGLEEIVDFVRFPCVAAAVWGKIANNVINWSLLDTLVPKLKKLMMN